MESVQVFLFSGRESLFSNRGWRKRVQRSVFNAADFFFFFLS